MTKNEKKEREMKGRGRESDEQRGRGREDKAEDSTNQKRKNN
jgi:hypothetical protein